MISDLTILIQGRCEVEQLQLWIDNYSDWNVIVSTWDDNNFEFPSNWKVIKSEYPERFADMQNIDLQITSTLNGLNFVETEYVVKVRGDEFYSNMELVYNRMKVDTNKILCSSIFFRPLGLYPFHISDHIFCSTTKNVKLMFDTCLDILKSVGKYNNCPETHLGFSYIASKENFDRYNLHTYIDKNDVLMKKWYSIIDINELKPYIATQSSKGGRLYYKDDYGHCSHAIDTL
jgi:hypothetical protein